MDDKTRALLGDREAAKRLTDAGVVLMQGDCLELLQDIPDGSVDRLTYWCDNWHGGGKWFVAIDAEGREDYGPHVDRLAAYEETGLEPGEIEQLKGEVFGLRLDKQELEQYRALGPIDRLRELKQADDEGRCVVLPFKPPRWVYMCSARFPKPAKAHYASAINVLQDMDSGCVFGDTPKEAEDALRREQEKEKEDEHETS